MIDNDRLNQADMQIDKYGKNVGYEKRLEDIKNSEIYIKAQKLIESLRKKSNVIDR